MNGLRAFASKQGKPRGILVVDDDVHVLKSLTRMLGSLGFTSVFQAASTREAREIWRIHRPDIGLIITDFVMPEETGDRMASEMHAENSALKVLLISGNDPLTLDSVIPLSAGINFLQKPFTVGEMRKSIESLSA